MDAIIGFGQIICHVADSFDTDNRSSTNMEVDMEVRALKRRLFWKGAQEIVSASYIQKIGVAKSDTELLRIPGTILSILILNYSRTPCTILSLLILNSSRTPCTFLSLLILNSSRTTCTILSLLILNCTRTWSTFLSLLILNSSRTTMYYFESSYS